MCASHRTRTSRARALCVSRLASPSFLVLKKGQTPSTTSDFAVICVFAFFKTLLSCPTLILTDSGVGRRPDVAPERAARGATCGQRGARKRRRRRRFHTPRWKGGYRTVAGAVDQNGRRDGRREGIRGGTGRYMRWEGAVSWMVRDSMLDGIRGTSGRNGAGQEGIGPLPGLVRGLVVVALASGPSEVRTLPLYGIVRDGTVRCTVQDGTAVWSREGLVTVPLACGSWKVQYVKRKVFVFVLCRGTGLPFDLARVVYTGGANRLWPVGGSGHTTAPLLPTAPDPSRGRPEAVGICREWLRGTGERVFQSRHLVLPAPIVPRHDYMERRGVFFGSFAHLPPPFPSLDFFQGSCCYLRCI